MIAMLALTLVLAAVLVPLLHRDTTQAARRARWRAMNPTIHFDADKLTQAMRQFGVQVSAADKAMARFGKALADLGERLADRTGPR